MENNLEEKFDGKVFNYEFSNFEDGAFIPKDQASNLDISSYDFTEFSDHELLESPEQKEIELKVERAHAIENEFKISPIVKKYRGLKQQEFEEREKLIEEEVAKRFALVEEKAYQDGFEKGRIEGKEEVFNQMKEEVEEKLSVITQMVNEVMETREEIFQAQKIQIYEMIRNLTKWIILRELKDDGKYINRLLEKLIVELDAKSNILIQVNKNMFEKMPEVMQIVEQTFGQLTNTRIEVDYDINDQGIIVHSDNGIINGTLEQQFENLEKLFESVGLNDSKE